MFVENKVVFSKVYLKISFATEVIKITLIVIVKYLKLCIQIEFHTSMQWLKGDKREVSSNCLSSQFHFKIPLYLVSLSQ